MTHTDIEDDRERAFVAAVCRLEADAQVPMLRRLIDRRAVIERLRARRVGWPEIAALLAGVGIEISAGGLRNYAGRIRRAVEHLHAGGENNPNGDRIYAVCREHARPAVMEAHRSARASPGFRKPDTHPALSARPGKASNPLMRKPDQEL